jgi:FtsZ-interacting cell division protein YlmF
MQLEKQIRSSVILENKLLAREGKKLCTKCKDIFKIDDLKSGIYCENCYMEHHKEYYKKNKDKIREYQRENAKEYYKKNKDKMKEHQREYREKNKDKVNERQRQYILKKKLEKEKENKIDPKAINAFMEELKNIKG